MNKAVEWAQHYYINYFIIKNCINKMCMTSRNLFYSIPVSYLKLILLSWFIKDAVLCMCPTILDNCSHRVLSIASHYVWNKNS